MHRIQVQLTAAQEAQLRDMARLRDVSISALIREGIDQLLAPSNEDWETIKAAALAGVGKFNSGLGDVSENHDAYLADDLYDEMMENRRDLR